MRPFDVLLVNAGTWLGFLRWATLFVLIILVFYLINKEKKIWKINLGVIALIVTVFLTPILILDVVIKKAEETAVVPNTSIDEVTVNTYSTLDSDGNSEQQDKRQSYTVIVDDTDKEDSSSSEPKPEPEPEPEPGIIKYRLIYTNIDNIVSGPDEGDYEADTEILVTAKEKVGYQFKWLSSYDAVNEKTDNPLVFKMPESDVPLTVAYTPNTDTSYRVIHQQQNLNDADYTTVETKELTGTTDTEVTPDVYSYTGFIAPASQTKPILGDGSMVITYQYKRDSFTLTVEDSDYVVEGDLSGEYLYEKPLSLTAKDRTSEDYVFLKWVDGDGQELGTEYNYSFTMPASEYTIRPVYEYVDPFPEAWVYDGTCRFDAYVGSDNKDHGLVSGDGCIEYAGAEYIDTGIALYDVENINKDYEISFVINHFSANEQLRNKQETIVNAKYPKNENIGEYGPGLVYRLLEHSTDAELLSRITGDSASKVVVPFHDNQQITIMRINGGIYLKIDDSALVQIQEDAISGISETFDITTWFGAAPNDIFGQTAKRFITGELSDISIRLGEFQSDGYYTITFDNGGGNISSEKYYVKKGDKIGVLPRGARGNNTIDGWFDSNGTLISSDYEPSANETLVPHWIPDISTANLADKEMTLAISDTRQLRISNLDQIEPVVFSSNDESVVTVDPETGLVTAVGAGETEVTITGLYSEKNRTVAITVFERRFVVEFDADGGEAVENKEVFPGYKVTPLPSTRKEGYSFQGWFTEKNGNGEQLTDDTIINDDMKYYAFWDSGSSSSNYVCKKATVLHTESCDRSSEGCRSAGYNRSDTITYGQIPVGTNIQSGDAYDCDVNGDNQYSSSSERFYYVTQNGANGVFVSHTNFEGDAGQNTTNAYSYSDAINMLPVVSQWSNEHLQLFDGEFEGRPARFLTKNELNVVWNGGSNINGSEFLFENSGFGSDSTTLNRRSGLWLQASKRIHTVKFTIDDKSNNNAARPTIEVPFEYIEIGDGI